MNSLSVSSIINDCSESIFCFYINITSQIQIIKITNVSNCDWKQVVFPGQQLIFEAMTSAKLEIYTNESAASMPSNIIPCQHLRVINETAKVEHFL